MDDEVEFPFPFDELIGRRPRPGIPRHIFAGILFQLRTVAKPGNGQKKNANEVRPNCASGPKSEIVETNDQRPYSAYRKGAPGSAFLFEIVERHFQVADIRLHFVRQILSPGSRVTHLHPEGVQPPFLCIGEVAGLI
ncbi:hypothetical protein AB4048_20395 [Rhizobium sp. RAF56]